MKRLILAFTVSLAVGIWAGSCATARHVAVIADAELATSVFAVSDATLSACELKLLPADSCNPGGAINLKMQAALNAVKAVTSSLQATPDSVTVPHNLPDLLTNLKDLQAMILPLATVPQLTDLVAKLDVALTKAIQLVSKFTGDQS